MRLIDADELLNAPVKLLDKGVEYIPLFHIERMPTIDAVKRGRWIAMSDADGAYWACSECGEDIPRISYYNPQFVLFPRLESIDKTNYCPNCGAKMDETVDE